MLIMLRTLDSPCQRFINGLTCGAGDLIASGRARAPLLPPEPVPFFAVRQLFSSRLLRRFQHRPIRGANLGSHLAFAQRIVFAANFVVRLRKQ